MTTTKVPVEIDRTVVLLTEDYLIRDDSDVVVGIAPDAERAVEVAGLKAEAEARPFSVVHIRHEQIASVTPVSR